MGDLSAVPTPRSTGARAGLVCTGFLALFLAWIMANPLTNAPDEPVQLYKALGAAHGQWSGEPATAATPSMTVHDRNFAVLIRSFRFPASYAVQDGAPGQGLECVTTWETAACQNDSPPPAATGAVPLPGLWDQPAPLGPPPSSGVFPSYVASYPPYVYLPLGLAARAAGNGQHALLAARAGSAVLCAVLLFGAARCSRGRAATVGLLVAVTPMAAFLASTVSTNGVEVAAALCTGAAGLALVRGAPGGPTWGWLAAGGAVLATSRVLGPAWVGCYAILLGGLTGRRGLARLVRARRAPALVTAAVVAAAVLACLGWDLTRLPALTGDGSTLTSRIGPAVAALPGLLDQAVGVFGWIDTPMPAPLYAAARIVFAALIVLALWAGTMRQRIVLVAAVALTAVATVAVAVLTQAPFGYPSQGRYTMAVAVAVPLLCGQILSERRPRLPRRVLGAALSAAALTSAVLHVSGWYAAAHSSAVGLSGPWRFWVEAGWRPVGGWAVWAGCAVLGATLLALAGLLGDPVEQDRSSTTGRRADQRGARTPHCETKPFTWRSTTRKPG